MNKSNNYETPECFKRAFDSLPEEDKIKYRNIGKYMYENFDYEKEKVVEKNIDKIKSKIRNIELAIYSGLLLDDLSTEEINLMSKEIGIDWYKKYNLITEKD